MGLSKSLLATLATLIVVGAVVVLVGNAYHPRPRALLPVAATSSVAVVPAPVAPRIEPAPTPAPAPTPVATSAPATPLTAPKVSVPKATVPKAAKPVVVSAVPSSVIAAQTASEIHAGLDTSASALRAALVNIICYAPVGSRIRSISGSGVVITSKGSILTNAHIAQYFLLADKGVSCKIRTGSPAAPQYSAALTYLPAPWIRENAKLIIDPSPTGTGEYDFALLAITGSLTSSALPSSFAMVPLSRAALVPNAPVVIGSYGAQFLEYSQIQSDLFPTLVFGSVKEVYTFVSNSIDILALGGSAAAQEGSSGGGVVNALGELAGTITTSTMEGTTASRQLNAITASYIRTEFERETGGSLDTLLSTESATAVAAFAPQAASLEATLVSHLP